MKKSVFTKFMSLTLAAAIALSFSGFIYADETGEGDTRTIVVDNSDPERRVVPDFDIDNDEMAERYIANKMPGSKSAEYRRFDFENQLNEDEQKAFQKLNPIIAQIAAGERASTKIILSEEDFSMTVSNSEAGVETFEGLSQDEVKDLVGKVIDKKFDLKKFVNALMFANPDNMYWFDKTYGYAMRYTKIIGNDLLTVSGFTFVFYVAKEYCGADRLTMNTEYGQAVEKAAANAGKIIEQNKNLDDYLKLLAYNNKICELTDYNDNAAAGGVSYGNPWQYIWVFDGDPETKVVCEGYAKAFQYLCDNSVFRGDDVYVITVRGKLAGEGHQWNIVHMDDDKNYLVDITNSDGNNNPTILFMTGAAGSVSEGYSKYNLFYTYKTETTTYFSEPQLTLSSTNYNPDKVYYLSLDCGANGRATLSKTSAKAGELISITTNPSAGYEVDKITVNGKSVGGNQFYMPGKDVVVKVTFKKIDFKINLKYNEGGKVTAPATANYGDLVTLTVTPDIGYKYNNWFYLNGYAETGNSFTMPDYDVNIEVKFEKEKFYIVAILPQHGTMQLSSEYATYGDKVTVTTVPDTGYELDYIKVSDNVIEGNEFIMPAESVYVIAYFRKAEYSIKTDSGIGGSAWTSVTKANYQDTVTVNAVPETGYKLDQIKVNNEVINGNTFTMPAKNVDVKVTFKKINYNLTVNATAGGTAKLSATTATYGDTIKVTATPDTGYMVDEILVNDEPIEGNTFSMPNKNVSVMVKFKLADYAITVNAGEGGTATAPASANYLEEVTIGARPATGYMVSSITVNGTPRTSNKFVMPAEPVTIVVTFAKVDYSITVNAGEGGQAKASASVANYQDLITLDVTPDTGYEVDQIKVNGEPIDGNTFKMPAAKTTVEVTFRKAVYEISLTCSEGGGAGVSIPEGNYGDEVSIEYKAYEGYHFDRIIVNGVTIDGTTFTIPAENVTIRVIFEKNSYDVKTADTTNGTVSVSAESVTWGSEVKVNVVPAKSYELDKLTYTPEGGEAVDITNAKKFTMPKANVTVEATFKKAFVPTPTATATPTTAPKATVTPTTAPKATATPTAVPKVTSKPSAPTATVTPKATAKPTTASKVTVTLDKTSANLVCGKTVTLKASVKGSSAKVTWKSSNTKIATVDASGKVTAKQAGLVTITATAGGASSECKIQVLFKDVTNSKDFWYEPTYYLVNKDVVKGYDNQTNFKPTNDCTRAQMVTFLWRLQGEPAPKTNSTSFTDIKSSDYFFKPVLWAVEKGITTGVSKTKFDPQGVCTRAQTVTFLWRMAKKPAPKTTANKFTDVKKGDYFYNAVLWAAEKKIVAGYDDNTFRPQGKCLRRQMVTFLYKYDKFVNGKG
ncbi:MAG: S-layer homology domain-containing protein [Clostridiales bacterium]|nr:S-layer homology domain-containing protein [Clostridiales bacterium]